MPDGPRRQQHSAVVPTWRWADSFPHRPHVRCRLEPDGFGPHDADRTAELEPWVKSLLADRLPEHIPTLRPWEIDLDPPY